MCQRYGVKTLTPISILNSYHLIQLYTIPAMENVVEVKFQKQVKLFLYRSRIQIAVGESFSKIMKKVV